MLPVLIASALIQTVPDTVKLGLRQAMDAARREAYAAESARSRSRELDAKSREAYSALLPQVGATASDVIHSFDLPAMGLSFPAGEGASAFPNKVGPFNAQDARVTGQIALFDAPAWRRYKAATLDFEKGRLDAAQAEENVAVAAAEAYLELSRERALMASRQSELELAAQLSDLTKAQKQAGTATQIEVLRAEGQVSGAKSALAAAAGAEKRARYVLLRILGMPLDVMPSLTDSLAMDKPAVPGETADAIADRPDVQAAEMEKRSARANQAAVKSSILPSLHLAGDYGLSGRRLNERAEWTETVALQLNWNLWDGGRRGSLKAQSSERVRQADLRSREVRSQAEEEARATRATMEAAQEVAAFASEKMSLAEEEEALSRERFKSGGSGNLEVITAQSSVSQAHLAYYDALFAYQRARLEYLKSTHRLSAI
jgi:outer membrane protein TolC